MKKTHRARNTCGALRSVQPGSREGRKVLLEGGGGGKKGRGGEDAEERGGGGKTLPTLSNTISGHLEGFPYALLTPNADMAGRTLSLAQKMSLLVSVGSGGSICHNGWVSSLSDR